MTEKQLIELLLAHLPDGVGIGSEDWDWCWNELNSDSQDQVKKVRSIAEDFLRNLNESGSGE